MEIILKNLLYRGFRKRRFLKKEYLYQPKNRFPSGSVGFSLTIGFFEFMMDENEEDNPGTIGISKGHKWPSRAKAQGQNRVITGKPCDGEAGNPVQSQRV
jgi:hypothetical protein